MTKRYLHLWKRISYFNINKKPCKKRLYVLSAQEDQFGRFGGGIFDFESEYSCSGSLTMLHAALHQSRSLNPALEELHSMKTARLTGRR